MVVYTITCITTSKVYVGITSRTLSRRWDNHIYRARTGWPGKLYSAMRKYGNEDFIIAEYKQCSTWQELLLEEIKAIAYFDSFETGYNLTLGGEGNLGWIPDDIWRNKMRQVQKNRLSITEDTRKKLSKATAGSRNPRFGVVVSEETKARIKRANAGFRKGIAKSPEHKQNIPIANCNRAGITCYNYKGECRTLRDWSKLMTISLGTLKKRVQTYGWSIEKALETPIQRGGSR